MDKGIGYLQSIVDRWRGSVLRLWRTLGGFKEAVRWYRASCPRPLFLPLHKIQWNGFNLRTMMSSFVAKESFLSLDFLAAKTVKVIHAGQWEHWFLLFLSLWDSPLCDNTQYSNHCVTSPITSPYQKSARSAITLFDSMYLCKPNVFVCDKYVAQVYQWTIRQLHFRPEWQVNICYCIVVTY